LGGLGYYFIVYNHYKQKMFSFLNAGGLGCVFFYLFIFWGVFCLGFFFLLFIEKLKMSTFPTLIGCKYFIHVRKVKEIHQLLIECKNHNPPIFSICPFIILECVHTRQGKFPALRHRISRFLNWKKKILLWKMSNRWSQQHQII
jgi:hypothetical protein